MTFLSILSMDMPSQTTRPLLLYTQYQLQNLHSSGKEGFGIIRCPLLDNDAPFATTSYSVYNSQLFPFARILIPALFEEKDETPLLLDHLS